MIYNCLCVTAIGLGITGVGLLSTIVAAPSIIEMEAVTIVMELLRVVGNRAIKKLSKPCSKLCSKPYSKIKKIGNKNMSFLKNSDPKKRDFIVTDFLRQDRKCNTTSMRTCM